MVIHGRTVENVLFSWFNRTALVQLRIYKLAPKGRSVKPWLLIRGEKDYPGYREYAFNTLGALFDTLFDHEIESLIAETKIQPMMLIAMAADGDTT